MTSRLLSGVAASAEPLVAWLCLSLAGTFLGWTLATGPAQMSDPVTGLAGCLAFFSAAAPAAGVACAVLYGFGATQFLGRLSLTSVFVYAGFLAVAGLALVPWAALVLALAVAAGMRRRVEVTPTLLLVHGMGILAGLYLVFSLDRYAAGWLPFVDVLRALWWLIV